MIKNTNSELTNFVTNDNSGAFLNSVVRGPNTEIFNNPYVSGYFYIYWLRLPEFMKNQVSGIDFSALHYRVLKSVEIPSRNLNTIEVQMGFGGTNKIVVPTTIETDTTLTMSCLELEGTPFSQAVRTWITAIRDPASGTSSIAQYGKKAFTGTLLYITTKPVNPNTANDKKIIETAYIFTNVFPTIDNTSLFSSAIDNSNIVEPQVQWKFDNMVQGVNVNKIAEERFDTMTMLKDMEDYSFTQDFLMDANV